MTHLKIELNNGITEEVSSDVIKKLYDIVHSGNLDLTSNLVGRLHTTATYQNYIDYLEDTFKVNNVKLLIIDATRAYLMFEDPEVLRIILSHNVGDGTGVSASDLTSVTNIDTWFRNNTTITSLNDLLKFTNVISISNIATNDTNLISATLREGLLEIKGNCFYNCSSLLTINFPSTLTKINDNRQYNDYGAFQDCTSLTTITGGENITVLGPAFTNCSSLLSLGDIDLSNLIHLGGSCFSNCLNLELGSVTLSNSITTMGDRVFAECKKLTSINIPGVTTITPGNGFSQGSFYNCDHLTTVTGSNIAYVGQMSFRYCSALSSIDLSNCTYIGICAFLECTSLTSIDLSNCTTIEGSAFYSCSGLTSVTFPSVNYTLGGKAFYGCTALALDIDLTNCTDADMLGTFKNTFAKSGITSIKTSLYINKIGGYDNANEPLFFVCRSLEKADLSQSTLLTSIDALRMFHGCKNLKYVKFPSTITEFKKEIFFNGSASDNYLNTIKIYLPCTTPPTMTKHTLCDKSGNGVLNPTLEIYVPTNSISAYQADADWNLYTILDILNYSES